MIYAAKKKTHQTSVLPSEKEMWIGKSSSCICAQVSTWQEILGKLERFPDHYLRDEKGLFFLRCGHCKRQFTLETKTKMPQVCGWCQALLYPIEINGNVLP